MSLRIRHQDIPSIPVAALPVSAVAHANMRLNIFAIGSATL